MTALSSNTIGSNNLALGRNAGRNLTTGSDNIDIANLGRAGEAGTIRIGNNSKQTATFIAGVSGTPLGHAARPVLVKSNGRLGVPNELSAKASTADPLSATVRRLAATVKRQQRQIGRLQREVGKHG